MLQTTKSTSGFVGAKYLFAEGSLVKSALCVDGYVSTIELSIIRLDRMFRGQVAIQCDFVIKLHFECQAVWLIIRNEYGVRHKVSAGYDAVAKDEGNLLLHSLSQRYVVVGGGVCTLIAIVNHRRTIP